MSDTKATTYRLTDILTKEVSIVDRAANQRKFLVVKRDEGAAKPLEQDGKGGFKTEKSEAAQAAPPGNTDPKASDPGKVDPPATQKETLTLKMAKRTYEGIAKAIEELTKLAQAVKPEELADADDEQVESAIASAVGKLGTVIADPKEQTAPGWIEGVCKVSRVDLHKATKTASEKLNEVAESLALKLDGDPPEEVRWKIMDVLSALVQLSQFETAQAALQKRQSEADAYRTLLTGISKALETSAAAPAPVPTEKRFDEESAVKLVALAEKVVKAQRGQLTVLRKRVRELEAEPLQSNRIAVDLHKQREGGRTTWPSDMNAKHLSDDDYDFDRANG